MPDAPFSILVPTRRHAAIEERFATDFSRLRLHQGTGARMVEYEPGEPASTVATRIATDLAVVLTDDTLLAPPGLAAKLVALLEQTDARAVIPTAADSPEPAQRAATAEPYLVLGQFDEQAGWVERSDRPVLDPFTWQSGDPGIHAIRTESLARSDRSLTTLLDGERVALARRLYVHRFVSMRGQPREDLLERVPPDARTILEFGCGEGALAAAIKARQDCRIVGVELDESASAIAATRVDRLVAGDVRDLLSNIGETFELAIGGDIVEHLDDPWGFLRRLRAVMRPGGRLLLSLPNIGCWPVVREAMKGRFDYVYVGITCVGHLRFFTRRTIEEMIELTGWRVVTIEPQPEFRTPGWEPFVDGLRRSGLQHSEPDLLAPGYYVTAESPGSGA